MRFGNKMLKPVICIYTANMIENIEKKNLKKKI